MTTKNPEKTIAVLTISAGITVLLALLSELLGRRDLSFGFSIVGFTFLFICLFLERKNNIKYKLSELKKSRKTLRGVLELQNIHLLVCDKWSLKGNIDVGACSGRYTVHVTEWYNDRVAFVAEVLVKRDVDKHNATEAFGGKVLVDTGMLVFISDFCDNLHYRVRIKKAVERRLKIAHNIEPLWLWIDDDEGEHVGFVVGSGEGDGEYIYQGKRRDGIVEEVHVKFMEKNNIVIPSA